MTQKNLISATKANSLYWLGRYEERVYITLHLLRKCYDKMIDGELTIPYYGHVSMSTVSISRVKNSPSA